MLLFSNIYNVCIEMSLNKFISANQLVNEFN